jgi:hypothetical protein
MKIYVLEVWLYQNGLLLNERNVGFSIRGKKNEIHASFKREKCNLL